MISVLYHYKGSDYIDRTILYYKIGKSFLIVSSE